MLDNIDYQELNERVEKAVTKRKKLTRYIMFFVSICLVLLMTILAWGIAETGTLPATNAITENDPIAAAMILLTLGGFLSLLMNGIGLMVDSGIGDKQMRSQVLAEILGEQIQEMANSGKTKREETDERLSDESTAEVFELSDDGELVQRKQSK